MKIGQQLRKFFRASTIFQWLINKNMQFNNKIWNKNIFIKKLDLVSVWFNASCKIKRLASKISKSDNNAAIHILSSIVMYLVINLQKNWN